MKKIINLLFALLLSISLVACNSETEPSNTTEVTASFDTWVDSLVSRVLSGDSDTINQFFTHPEEAGITKELTSWSFYDVEAYKDEQREGDAIYAELLEFNRDDLSDSQKEVYDVLEFYFSPLDESLWESFFYISNNPLGSYVGILANISLSFYYWNINDELDAESFINLMETLDDYAANLIAYEQERQDKGYGMTPEEVTMSISDVEDSLEISDYSFISESFIEKVNALDIDEAKKEEYINKVSNEMNEAMVDFYTLIYEGLNNLDVKQESGATLFDLENGLEYYEQMIYVYTGFESMEEYYDYLTSKMGTILNEILAIDYEIDTTQALLDIENPTDVVEYLKEAMKEDFPSTAEVEYNLIEAPDALKSLFGGTVAFYMLPALDERSKPQEMTLVSEYTTNDYMTIAHEGYPGHLYQYVYNLQENDKPYIINLYASSSGYSEGYANYVERYSAKYATNQNLANYNVLMNEYSYFYICLIDYRIHYLGEDVSEEVAYLFGEEYAPMLIEQLQFSPAIFTQYYVSGAIIEDMHAEVNELVGEEVSDLDFHTALLSHGSMPLHILREYILADFS